MRAFTSLIARRPILVATIGFAIPLFFSTIAFVAYPLELQTGAGAWYPRESEVGRREDGLIRAEEETVFDPSQADPASYQTAQQESVGRFLSIYFWRKDGSTMLTSEGLAKMHEVEKFIFNRDGFETVCLRNPEGGCYEADSLTEYVYSVPIDSCPTFRVPNGSATTQAGSNILALLEPVLNTSAPDVYCTGCGTDCIGQGADAIEDYVVSTFSYPDHEESFALKSVVRFGLPLDGYSNAYDRRKEQLDKIDDFINGMSSELLEDGFSSDGITVRAISASLLNEYFENLIWKDIIWVVLAIALVGIFIFLHTRTVFLTVFGMSHVILSFPFSYFFMQAFFDIGAVGVLNFLSIFIILGIGADDIFILLDAWKQSKNAFPPLADDAPTEERHSHMAERLYWTYHRASWAMLVTSLTTSAAFMMNVVSSVMPIQIFGIQTAFMVLTNYFMVITYFPALVFIWEWYGIRTACARCSLFSKKETTEDTDKKIINEKGAAAATTLTIDSSLDTSSTVDEVEGDTAAVHNIEEYRWLERFLHNKYGPGVYKARWFTFAAFTLLIILSIVYATKIEVSSEPAQWVPDSDPVQEVLNLDTDHFSNTAVTQVAVLAGIKEIDRNGVNPFNAEDIGNPVFVSSFDLSSELAQTTYVSNCEEIMGWDYVVRNSARNETGVLCPMIEFKDYVENTLGKTFPVPQAEFIDTLVNFTKHIAETEGPGIDQSQFKTLDDRTDRRGSLMSLQQTIRFHRNIEPPTLAYMVTVVNSTIHFSDPASKIEPVYNYFEGATSGLTCVSGYCTSLQTCVKYLDMRLEQGLVRDAVFAIFVSLTLTLVIVSLTTRDFLLSIMSTVTIGMVVLTMIANIVWLGWDISIIESICLTILVGLSVDYTIHLANAWRTNIISMRQRRLNATLLEIGISVMAAAVTTFLSAIPLLLTIIIFFFRFGIFILLTVMWSSIYAFGLFLTLLVVFGSTQNRDDFYWLYLAITRQDRSKAYLSSTVTLPTSSEMTTNTTRTISEFDAPPALSDDEGSVQVASI